MKYLTTAREIVIIFAIIAGLFYGYKVVEGFKKDFNSNMIAQNTDFAKLADGIVQAQTEMVKKIDELKINPVVEKKIKQNKAKVKNTGTIKGSLAGKTSKGKSDKKVIAIIPNDQNQYFEKDIKNGDLIWASATFFPNKDADNQWLTVIPKFSFNTTVTRAEDRNGTITNYAEMTLSSNGKTIPINIDSANFKEIRPVGNQMFWFDPHLDFGLGWSTNTFGPELGVSLSGYGITKNDLIFRGPEIGVGFSWNNNNATNTQSKTWAFVEPIEFNVGRYLPLLSNVWMGPEVTVPFSTNVTNSLGYGAAIKSMF